VCSSALQSLDIPVATALRALVDRIALSADECADRSTNDIPEPANNPFP